MISENVFLLADQDYGPLIAFRLISWDPGALCTPVPGPLMVESRREAMLLE